jgi:glycosyltransferase involved in cell wall biosynthesis
MCLALVRAGVDVTLASSDADGDGRLEVPLEEPIEREGVPSIFFARAASEAFKWTPALSRWLRSNTASFDIVHVHAVFSHACLATGRACRRAGRPYLVRPLGSLDPWSLRRHRVRKRVLMTAGARSLLQGAAAIHYTSAEERRLAEGALAGLPPGVVVPLGVDDELFKHAADTRRTDAATYVLSLSRLDPKKGVDVVIRAFHLLAEEGTAPPRLVIAGDGPAGYVASLRAIAGGGAARDLIEFRGWVDGDERRGLLQGSAVYVLPSRQENFGISVAEAMASGVPVVISPGVNLADDVIEADAGWITEPEPSALAALLRTVLASGAELERRGNSARALAERFRWSRIAHELLRLYDEILRGGLATLERGAMSRIRLQPDSSAPV